MTQFYNVKVQEKVQKVQKGTYLLTASPSEAKLMVQMLFNIFQDLSIPCSAFQGLEGLLITFLNLKLYSFRIRSF